MKTNIRNIFTVTALVALAAFSSCRKRSYSCDCETKLSVSGSSQISRTSESYSEKMKGKQLKSACSNTEATLEKQVKEQQKNAGWDEVSVSCILVGAK